MNKTINSTCICNNGLPSINNAVIMLNPCEHLIHLNCLNLATKCPYCNVQITSTTELSDFKHDKQLYQKCIDILSMTNFDNRSLSDPLEVFKNLPHLLVSLAKVPFARGIDAGIELCKNLFDMNNIKIIVKGSEYIKNTNKKVFIANHTSRLDVIILFYILKTGFLASDSIRKSAIGRQIINILPCLLIKRGYGASTVNKMRDYIEQHGSLCLFPEGILTHPDTLIRFRSGAFNIGFPVYPVIIKYDIPVTDMSIPKFILKIASNQKMTVTVTILEPFYPPFDENKIEQIRLYMAYSGNMMLSRVSNRDVND